MSKFEDRLWRQIVREHGAELAQMRRRAAKRAWQSRPRMLAGTTLGLAGIGTAVALLLGAASSTPAFAVTQNSDGTVSVTIQRLSGIAGANQRLASLGIRARAVAVGAGCDSNWTVKQQVITGALSHKPATPAQLRAFIAARVAARAKIDPDKIPAGRTVVIATWRAGKQVHLYASRAVAGPPPACLAPAAAAKAAKAAAVHAGAACRIQVLPAGGNTGSSGNSGNSGNSGSATSGSATSGSATSGSANSPKVQAVKPPSLKELKALVAKARARAAKANGANSGSSGTTGNSGPNGNSGNSGNSGSGGYTVVAPHTIDCTPLPTTGNSGHSGNSGTAATPGTAAIPGTAATPGAQRATRRPGAARRTEAGP